MSCRSIQLKIQGLAVYVGEERQAIEALSERLRLSERQIRVYRRFGGFDQVAQASRFDLRDILVDCGRRAFADAACESADVTHLIYCHTTLPTLPFDRTILADVAADLGLSRPLTFALNLAHCASGLLALDAVDALLPVDARGVALILIGEPCRSRLVQLIPGSAILGEAAVGIVASRHKGRLSLQKVARRIDGRSAVIDCTTTPEGDRAFHESYESHLAGVIGEALASAELSPSDLALVLPHNVNASSWHGVAARCDIAPSRIYLENLARYGHCFGADPFVNLHEALAAERLRPQENFLLTGVGLGATYAALLGRVDGEKS